jgi:CheY-like chemotaxis protein
MEAVGRLAGGIAHDFNNILTAIMGCAQLLAPAVAGDSQAAEDAATIIDSAVRAAALTRQLLTFSRRQAVENVTFDLNHAVGRIQQMLKRTLGEDVRFAIELEKRPLWILADAGQVDQVLLNLAVNARDAMPRGGLLTVATSLSELTAPRVSAHDAAPPGVYARVSFADSGTGMSEDVLAHLFEPFFTTKEIGKGTGLGLSSVYGIVKQGNGHLFVDSVPGRGTTFDILFPLVAPPAERAESAPADAPAACTETILLVEDEDAVLKMVQRTLKAQGYTVLPSRNAAEALEISDAHRGRVHLLLTDVVMPGMSGPDLARLVTARHPGARVLLMSAYPDGRLEGGDIPSSGRDLLQKPFQLSELSSRVRKALDGESGSSSGR